MIDLIAEHWNNALTVCAFVASVVTGYYQVKHYRTQQADVNILSIEDKKYGPRIRDDYGSPRITDDLEGQDEIHDTKYSMQVLIENNGRDPATVSESVLTLPDTNEELSLYNERTRLGWTSSFIDLEANDRKEVSFYTSGEVRDEYDDQVQGVLRLDTSAGIVEETVTFEWSS